MKREFMTDINKIKFEVYREVARMAFDGKLCLLYTSPSPRDTR